ncbi:MAG: membrane dipeptidase [Bacteroidota bacterium]
MMNNFYVNIHCHPTMKPFGKSFSNNKVNNANRKKKDSIWYYNPPTLFDKLANYLISVTKFAQSDFSSSAYGDVRVMCVSLYPLEKSFCVNRLGTGLPSDLPMDFVLEMGRERINHIQASTNADYFQDLKDEYEFLKQLHNRPITLTDGRAYKYVLVKNYTELQAALNNQFPTNQPKANPPVETIAVMITFEGAHAFGCGIDAITDETKLFANIQAVKNWEHRPFFITFAHHFYNQLCGHAKSLEGFVSNLLDQSEHLGTPFTPLGLKVADALLDNTHGKRILIDIKHMSEEARNQYFALLDSRYPGEKIPIVVSHGCVRGNESDKHQFYDHNINFSDEEILRLAMSDGLFGVQLDERRIGSPSALQQARGHLKRTKILYHWSALVWNQIRHIAELLDSNGLFAWGNICLGTDFDGIIDPINGYWTHEDMPDLETYLLMHAHNYMTASNALTLSKNKIHEEEIVSRFMTTNALDFFSKHFV